MKDVKQSTKQRFHVLDFGYPEAVMETEVIRHGIAVNGTIGEQRVQIAHRAHNLKGHGLDEGIAARLLFYAARLIATRASSRKRPAR